MSGFDYFFDMMMQAVMEFLAFLVQVAVTVVKAIASRPHDDFSGGAAA